MFRNCFFSRLGPSLTRHQTRVKAMDCSTFAFTEALSAVLFKSRAKQRGEEREGAMRAESAPADGPVEMSVPLVRPRVIGRFLITHAT